MHGTGKAHQQRRGKHIARAARPTCGRHGVTLGANHKSSACGRICACSECPQVVPTCPGYRRTSINATTTTPHHLTALPTNPPTEPETAERTTRDSNTTARTVLPSWHGTGNEQPRRRLLCASVAAVVYIVLQTACNSLGGKPNKPSPVAKQCTPG